MSSGSIAPIKGNGAASLESQCESSEEQSDDLLRDATLTAMEKGSRFGKGQGRRIFVTGEDVDAYLGAKGKQAAEKDPEKAMGERRATPVGKMETL